MATIQVVQGLQFTMYMCLHTLKLLNSKAYDTFRKMLIINTKKQDN